MKLQILRKLIPIACLLVSMNVLAYDFESGGIYYNITSSENKTVEVTYKDYSYNSYTGEVTIPGSVTHEDAIYNVTSIGNYAFRDCSGLTSVTIPNSVTSIGYYAFSGCSGLTSVTIPNSVTSIGEDAFSGCSGLTSITIPNSVTSVGNCAFNGCTSLKDLKIEDGTEILELGYNNCSSYPGKGLFYDCPLETVYLGRNLSYNTSSIYGYSPFYNQKALKTITIGNNVTSIGENAFYKCSGLTSVTIPNSVTSIGGSAFSGCSGFSSITIPNSVTSIGSSLFRGCTGLTSITIPNSVTSIVDYAFSDCSGLTSVTIPNSVTSVGNYVFEGCTSLKDLKIEDGAEILELGYNYYSSENGDGLFYDCPLETVYLGRNLSYNTSYSYGYSPFYNQKALKAITIGNSVTSIGDYAFYNCSGLTCITIPNSVTSIGDYALYKCSGLTSVTFESITPPSIGQNAFYNVDATFKVPFTSVFAYKAIAELKDKTFGGFEVDGIYYRLTSDMEVEVTFKDKNYKSYTGEVVIPSEITVDEKKYNVTSIGENAFVNCSGLTSITIPNSVTSIGGSAFGGCSSLTEVVFNAENCTKMGSSSYPVFKDCTTLTDLTIGENVKIIPNYAFYNCSGLTSVTIPNSVTSVGSYAFNGCTSLKDLKIEDGTEILELGYNYYNSYDYSSYTGEGLFYDCPLETVYLGRNLSYNTNKRYGYSPFSYQKALKTITIGNSVTSIGDYAFYNCSGLTCITIPNSVTSIGGSAFSGCSGLTSITIPNSVTSIGSSLFRGCTGLTSIIIPNSVTSIGDNAFFNCSGLTSITIPNSVTSVDNYAFNGCTSLKDLKIEDGTEILELGYNSAENGLFYDCPLETVYLGRNLSDNTSKFNGYSPFSYQKALKTITIGNNVTSIGYYAFLYCSGLTSVTIPNSVTSIGGSAFSGCSGLTSVTIPNSVTSIGHHAFSGCSGLTSITIPNSVTSIGHHAFDGCSGLTSITIPNSVTQIGNYAFGDCTSLKDLKIEDGTEILKLGYNYDSSSYTGEGLFYDCPLETVYLGRNLSYNTSYNYGYSPFYNQKALKAITIGNSVTSIGDYTFYNCSGLTSVIIGNSVTSISSSAFSRCYIKKAIWLTNTPPQGYANLSSAVHYVANKQYTSLNNVTIYPYLSSLFEVDGIKYVPVSPSERTCDAIDCAYDTTATNINIENTVSYKGVAMTLKEIKPYTCNTNDYIKQVKINFSGSIDKEAFSGCTAITSAEIKASIIDKEAFYGCSSLETITVNAKSLGTSAFASCATKESAIFEISVQTIGDNSFKGCTKVESITLSDNLISIGDNAFERCPNLKEIVIPDAVKSLGGYAFSGCSSLEDITIGASVATIKESAFSGCSKLPEITIPSNVTSIGDYVFDNCTSLATVVINDRDTDLSLGSNDSNPLFYSCPLDSVYIGGNITYPTSGSKGYSPFYRNTNLRSVVITDKETEISENEFYGCSNLKNISMGDGVETIGKWAFSGCSSLDYFAFGSGMKTIGEEAFSDCTAMTKLISRTTTPPTCGTQALDDINKWVCELFVPQSAVTAYQGANQWKEFFFITGTESSGVESTLTDEVDVSVENGNIVIKGADNAMIEVYSLNGQCVYSGIETTISIAAKGLYVVKVNGKSFKVKM